jgi:LuxR family maltose regulon positive regulatory protein
VNTLRDKGYGPALIQTKLNRPALPVDLVPRPRLTAWLEQRRSSPLTLVSAPAGYGKSTMISCWLENVGCPTAWVSLDERDNELGGFLSYFIAAIMTILPKELPESQTLLTTTPLPPLPAIAKLLVNELNQIDRQFILVLDDYHLIKNQTIHDLLAEVLLHPPQSLHLVLGTRVDPPLPLVSLRAKGQLSEVRIPSLRFNQDETRLLIKKMTGASINKSELMEIESKTEGWVTGMRLASLAMRHRVGHENLQGKLTIENSYLTEYLVSEILAKHATSTSECMLKTSILERFCSELCEAVCFLSPEISENGSSGSELDGSRFLEWLQASNLFVIPLDGRREWFRYHHLFRDFLRQQLVNKISTEEIGELHTTAGRWYAQNGWIEEALSHFLTAGRISAAIELIAQKRYGLMNNTQWPRLERWLGLFTQEVVESSAELWMLKTWLAYHHGQLAKLPALLQHLDAVLARDPNQERADRLAGEINSLRSLIAYYSGDAQRTISWARLALDQLPSELWIVRAMVRMYLGGGLQMSGDENGAYHALYNAFEEEQIQHNNFKATLLLMVCNLHWVAADLQSMDQAAKQCIALCQEIDFRQILGYGNYQLGRVCYQRNDLSAANELFASVVASPYLNYGISYTNSACGLALTYQALGKETEARETIEEAIAFHLETGNITQLPLVQASQAEVALMQGRLAFASKWAAKQEPVPPLAPMPWFLAPHLTLVKVWLAQKTLESKAKAHELLDKLRHYLADTHNTRFLIEALALQALWDGANGDNRTALAGLESALRLALPGGLIRVFVDLGKPMGDLFSQMRVDRELGTYIDKIQAAFSKSQINKTAMSALMREGAVLDKLTPREWEILQCLGKRLTNKEIAAQLGISPGTVKGHNIRVYQKLDVKNRRKAVEKAVELGILDPS